MRRGLFSLNLSRKTWSGIGGAVPPILYITLLFLLPVLIFLGGAFDDTPRHLVRSVSDPLYQRVLIDTLMLGLYVTGICFILGYPLAYALSVMPPRWALVGFAFLLLPFWTSLLVRTYAWMVLLGRNGVINNLLMGLGLIDTPVSFLNNMSGVLIGMVHVLLPYMVFPLFDVMKRVDGSLLSAAEGLGAPGWKIFLRVYLPLTLPGILAGSVLVFVLSIGFYITPALLGGGRVATMALMIERQVREFLDWDFAAALSLVLLICTLLVSIGLGRLLRGKEIHG
ncbi:MAG: transporter permease [Xanthobacteraceae bacterium]|jgi:ABC-type spermidine/putrescine transport system permease subunit I|nr:transporter permease [Xanthobacteraceae bacterium]